MLFRSAPVRETAAQALATLLPFMPTSSVLSVQRILIAMVEQDGAPPSRGLDVKYEPAGSTTSERGKYVWQVRHSGLLGLKYLVAVKGELLRAGASAKEEDGDVIMREPVKKEEEDVEMGETTVAEGGVKMLKGVVDAALLGYVLSLLSCPEFCSRWTVQLARSRRRRSLGGSSDSLAHHRRSRRTVARRAAARRWRTLGLSRRPQGRPFELNWRGDGSARCGISSSSCCPR